MPFHFRLKLSATPIDTQQDSTSNFSLKLDQVAPCVVERFSTQADVKLVANTHAVDPSKRSAQFYIEENTNAHVMVELSSINDELYLDTIDLSFSKPIRLLNVFTTLDQLGTLYETPVSSAADSNRPTDANESSDLGSMLANNEFLNKANAIFESNAEKLLENAKKYADRVSDSSAWKFLKDAAARSGLSSGFEKSKEYSKELLERGRESVETALNNALQSVEISALQIARHIRRNAQGQILPEIDKNDALIFTMSGEVAINSMIKREFSKYTIPSLIVPTFSPNLSVLINQFCLDREQGGNLSRTILGMIENLEGTCHADLLANDWPIAATTRQGWHADACLHGKGRAKFHAQYAFKRSNDAFVSNVHAGIDYRDRSDEERHIDFELSSNVDTEKLILCGHELNAAWITTLIDEGNDIVGSAKLHPCSHFALPHVGIVEAHPWLKDEAQLQIDDLQTAFSGDISWGIDIANHQICLHALDLTTHGGISLSTFGKFSLRGHEIDVRAESCHFDAVLRKKPNAPIDVNASIQTAFRAKTQTNATTIPELKLVTPMATIDADGFIYATFSCRIDHFADDTLCVTFDNSSIDFETHRLAYAWPPLTISQDVAANLSLRVQSAQCTVSGLSDCHFSISYRSAKAPTIGMGKQSAPLFPKELLDFSIDAEISKNGILTFSNGSGFYNEDFFNTLLKPNSERENWAKILQHEPLFKHILDIARVVLFPAIDGADEFCSHVGDWIQRCIREDIFSVSALIHPPTLAYALSLLLFDDDSATDEILPSIERIMHADGIDRYKIEELLDRAYPNANLDNLGRVLKWLQHLFQTVPYIAPKHTSCPPLCDDPRCVSKIERLPSANEIYAPIWSDQTGDRILNYAAGLNIAQIEWIIDNKCDQFPTSSHLEKLRTLLNIKRKISGLEIREGAFIVQDFNIAVFLGALLDAEIQYCDKIGIDPDSPRIDDVFRSWLAPVDVATLLAASISSRYIGFCVQMNQARLFNYLERRGTLYARSVLYEIGQRNIRVLANMLISWLRQDQSYVKIPIARAKRLSALLKIDIPDEDDYTPWNSTLPASYVEAIFNAAEEINAHSDDYVAARLKLESYRDREKYSYNSESAEYCAAPIDVNDIRCIDATHNPSQKTNASQSGNLPSPPPDEAQRAEEQTLEAQRAAQAIAALRSAIESAQNASQRLCAHPCDSFSEVFDSLSAQEIESAQDAWKKAFDTAKVFVSEIDDPWQYRIVKDFWARTLDALRIASVYDDLQNDFDEVRRWFAYRYESTYRRRLSAITDLSRAETYDAIIDFIFAFDDDKRALRLDPLVWFMPTVAAGNVKLTLITAMGIITSGSAGHELEAVFERLRKSRNIATLRTNTGTIKPLQYNADQIVRVVAQVDGPFAIVGYSQGCANMMRAEADLYNGTPDQRKLLDNLVSRNFICSAFNGSPHATCGVVKYKNALVEGEAILKSFSASLSRPLYRLIFDLIKRILDTPIINASLTSVESISPEGLFELARDSQFAPHVPSIEASGATNDVPEGLVIMANHFNKQAFIANDSQIGIDCAHAYPVFNDNDTTKRLKDQAVSPRLLNIHHWSPLVEEVRFIESKKDVQTCIYKCPKSLFITPWIDSLILFGILEICD